MDILLYLSSFSSIPIKKKGGGGDNDNVSNKYLFISLITLYYVFKYASLPLSWFFGQIRDGWCLYRYIKAPFYHNKALKAETIFVRSLYLSMKKKKTSSSPYSCVHTREASSKSKTLKTSYEAWGLYLKTSNPSDPTPKKNLTKSLATTTKHNKNS